MRNESVGLHAAIDESIQIGEAAGLPVHIYHLKAAGKRQWPLMTQAIERIDAARRRGLDVTSDIYPYIRNGIGLESFLPPTLYVNGFAAAKKLVAQPAKRRELRAELDSNHQCSVSFTTP